MASNGYVRACCRRCLFYSDDSDFRNRCILYSEMWDADRMDWVSANDCERSPLKREKYYEECEHYSDVKELRNQIRERFGIKRID